MIEYIRNKYRGSPRLCHILNNTQIPVMVEVGSYGYVQQTMEFYEKGGINYVADVVRVLLALYWNHYGFRLGLPYLVVVLKSR
jgi:hypothetical protein